MTLVRGDRRGVRHHVGAALGGVGVCPAGRRNPFGRPTGRGAVARRRPSGGTGPRAADGPLPTSRACGSTSAASARDTPWTSAPSGCWPWAWPTSCSTAARAACWPGAAGRPADPPAERRWGRHSCLPRADRNVCPTAKSWEIGVRHPRQPGRRLGVVRLRDRALGTSGGQFQSFRHRGRRYGHILDPRSGWPAEGVLSTTVVAPTAALADALSTAFYVMGPDRSLDYCRTHPGIGAVLICAGPHGEESRFTPPGLTRRNSSSTTNVTPTNRLRFAGCMIHTRIIAVVTALLTLAAASGLLAQEPLLSRVAHSNWLRCSIVAGRVTVDGTRLGNMRSTTKGRQQR